MSHLILGIDPPPLELTLKSAEEIDRELVGADISYKLAFLREKGRGEEADLFVEELNQATVIRE